MPSDTSIKPLPAHFPGSLWSRLAFFARILFSGQRIETLEQEQKKSGLFLLWLAFFCSGMAGLSYELTWAHFLTQLFGASTPAVSATVSIFFLGLALGAGFGGKWFDRSKRPLLMYAFLEVCIGLCAVFVPFFFQMAEFILATQTQQGSENPIFLFALSTAILLIPTTLLGATFPAMAAVVRHLANPTYSTGFFYGFNTLGAVAGSLLVSFVLLPMLGQHYTTWWMASSNLLIACLLWAAYRWFNHTNDESGSEETTLPRDVLETGRHAEETVLSDSSKHFIPFKIAAVMAGGSGFLAIGIEVLWTRALSLSFPSSRYVFALVLAAYLTGIALGSIGVGSLYQRRRGTRQHLLLMYMAIGFGSMLTLFLFPRLMPFCASLVKSGWLVSWSGSMAWIGSFSVLAMLPATLMMGAALPLLIGLATEGKENASRTAGRLYAINTLGGVLGSSWVTFWMLPALGLSPALFLLALGYAVLAGLMVLQSDDLSRQWRWATLSVILFGGILYGLGIYPEANPLRIQASQKLLFYQDDSSATLGVYERFGGVRSLHINNQHGLRDTDSSTVEMQYRLGHLSTMLHPDPKRLLLLGFGTGTTLAAVSQHPIDQIDCVALLGSSVLRLAPYFSKANLQMGWKRPLHSQTKVHVFAGDARRSLKRAGLPYDLIVGDLLLPSQTGIGALLSVEHFRAAKRRLTPTGRFVTWLPLHQLGPRELASVVQTFLKVFPRAEGWVASWSLKYPILGLVGRKDDLSLQISPVEAKLKSWVKGNIDAFQKGLEKVTTTQIPVGNVASSATLTRLSHKLLDSLSAKNNRKLLSSKMLKRLGHGAPINCLEKPVIEFMAPRSLMLSELRSSSLALQNIRTFAKLRSLRQTPWFPWTLLGGARSTE